MRYKVFRNIKTKEVVFEEDAEEYVLDQLGIKVITKGKNGEITEEQLDFIQGTIEWFFSGNWIEDEIQEDEGNVFELINEENE